MADITPTPFSDVYNLFLSKCTDDMYLELTEEDTEKMLRKLLISAIHWFEFPRQNLNDYDIDSETFNIELTSEEANIIATYMVMEWLGQQLAHIDLVRELYSGSDFKFTSQANHIEKLRILREQYKQEGFHLQRLYKRRKFVKSEGKYYSTMSLLVENDTDNPPDYDALYKKLREE